MRRDAIFYQIFQRYPALFFELIDQHPESAQRYQFTSVEIKEPSFRIDGVLLPPEDAANRQIFFAEVQFQPDQGLHHRFFAELFLYLYRNRGTYDSWHGTLIYPSRNLVPDDIQTHAVLLSSDQVQCIYLDELGEFESLPLGLSLVKLTVTTEAETIKLSQQIIQRARQQPNPFPTLEDILELVTTIAVYKIKALSREEIEAMLDLTIKETKVYREILDEGREEGREKGQVEKAIAVTKALLKIATMTPQQISQVTELPLEQVLELQKQESKEQT